MCHCSYWLWQPLLCPIAAVTLLSAQNGNGEHETLLNAQKGHLCSTKIMNGKLAHIENFTHKKALN